MKKALITHGWESGPNEHWYQEEAAVLERLGLEVLVPEMPGGTWPKKDEWVKIVADFNPDEETVLIGHSLGAPTILRYLENAEKKVGKVFLVAGFAKDLGMEETSNFVAEPFDWEKIKASANEIYVINEIDDPWVPLERGKEIAEATGAEFVPVAGNVHFDSMDLNLINSRL